MNANKQREQLATILLEEGLELWDVWLRYFSMGGSATEEELALYAVREIQLSMLQRDLISMALRELVLELQELRDLPSTRHRPRSSSDHGG